jgi:DAACS family dicarboxylate/amino acid:cation (Na+ or H+) symporter
MCRTTLNVSGDLTLATLVAHGESDEAAPTAMQARGAAG